MKIFLGIQQCLVTQELTEKSKFFYFPFLRQESKMTGTLGFTQNVSYIPFINFIMKMQSPPFKKKGKSSQRFVLLHLIKQKKNPGLWGVYEIVPV